MVNLYKKLCNREEKLSVTGLGYVGLPIAVAFARHVDVIGFDTDEEKIRLYSQGKDPTREVGDKEISKAKIEFTTDEKRLREARFHIVTVPTPINQNKLPDLSAIKSASTSLGRNLQKGSIVIFESTVYPGVTEDVCLPILEQESGLRRDIDFKIGYSPERINPGDKEHRLENITKVVSARDKDSLEIIAKVYELVVKVGVYRAESIKVAEAAKVIENSQRDINIAFMNELAIIFNKMGIDTKFILDAAGTKWNFLNFTPGLVGGHCIGVDPYYLAYAAEQKGYHSQVILAGRRINDTMGKYVAESTIKKMIEADLHIKGARVAILGFAFKENCPDVRNTRVIDIVKELREYGITPLVCDSTVDAKEVEDLYGITLTSFDDLMNLDAIIIAVAHDLYRGLRKQDFEKMYNSGQKKVMVDVKSLYDRQVYEEAKFLYWRL